MAPRIALIHATPLSIEPARDAFRAAWPEAATTNLLDDSLSGDLARQGRLDARMMDRFLTLAGYVAADGAEAILFTCSAFGPPIDRVKRTLPIPVLKPNEAAIDEALDAGGPIALVSTFAPTLASMRAEFEVRAAERELPLDLHLVEVEGAMEALGAGDAATHDARIAAAVEGLPQAVVVLAQFSMAHAAARIPERAGRRLLTTPRSAVTRLKRLLA